MSLNQGVLFDSKSIQKTITLRPNQAERKVDELLLKSVETGVKQELKLF